MKDTNCYSGRYSGRYSGHKSEPSLRMNLGVILFSLAVTTPALAVDLPWKKKAGTETEVVARGPIAACQGQPRASIAISRFDNKVRNWKTYSAGIGDGMADQLTTALVSTGCFKVVDRQNLKGVMDEIGLQNSGAVDPATASKIGKLVGADIIVTAAVTEFTDNSGGSKSKGGGIGAGRLGGVLGALKSGSKKAHMAADIRITDVQTSEILGATAVKGTATDSSAGVLVGAVVPGAAGLGALENWDNTPRGAALREVIENAVTALRTMIPQGYYRHEVGRFAPPPKKFSQSGNSKRSANGGSVGGGNPTIMKAQQTLQALGMYDGAVDGMMGPGTAAAVREFQSQSGLEVTGKLDLKTMKEIRSFSN